MAAVLVGVLATAACVGPAPPSGDTTTTSSTAPPPPYTTVPDPTQADLDTWAQGPVGVSAAGYAYGPDPANLVDVYTPVDVPSNQALILYVHPGGWTGGSRSTIPQAAIREFNRGFKVASIDYRLAPDHPFPEPLTDVKRAIRWAKANAATLGILPSRLLLAGTSSGGQLALMAAETVGTYEPTDLTPAEAAVDSRPAAVIDMVGPTDLAIMAQDSQVLGSDSLSTLVAKHLSCLDGGGQYSGAACTPSQLQSASPVNNISGTPPPLYLIYGGTDTYVNPAVYLPTFLQAYGGAAGASNVDYDLVDGGSHAAGLLSSSAEAPNVSWLDAFCDRYLS